MSAGAGSSADRRRLNDPTRGKVRKPFHKHPGNPPFALASSCQCNYQADMTWPDHGQLSKPFARGQRLQECLDYFLCSLQSHAGKRGSVEVSPAFCVDSSSPICSSRLGFLKMVKLVWSPGHPYQALVTRTFLLVPHLWDRFLEEMAFEAEKRGNMPHAAPAAAKSLQSCPSLRDSMDCSLQASSIQHATLGSL